MRGVAVAVVIMLVLAGVAGIIYYTWDSDGDGVWNTYDQFPNDPEEWKDTDRDGIGNNADEDDDNDQMPDDWEAVYLFDPLNPLDAVQDADNDELENRAEYLVKTHPRNEDTDNDTAKDGRDVDPRVNIIIVLQFTHYKAEDPMDIFGGQADVYFKVNMGPVILTSDVIYFDTDMADVPIDYSTILDVDDRDSVVNISFSWFDKDIFFDDKLDVSGNGDTCDITYNLDAHTWSGDTNIGKCSGNDDGSTTIDEDDITVDFLLYDSVGDADKIDEILKSIDQERGELQDFNLIVLRIGHVIIDELVDWILAHPDYFGALGGWGKIVSVGLQILGIVVYYYDSTCLQNRDTDPSLWWC